MSLSSNFPNLRPSLLLDFANRKRLDPRITFVRATTATYYNGETFAKAEENLVLQSQTFNTTWAATRASVTADSTTAPDGTTTADTLIEDLSAANVHQITQAVALGTTTGTASIHVKNYSGTRLIVFAIDDGTSANRASVTVNPANGSIFSAAATAGTFTSASATVTTVGTFYRIALTGTGNIQRFRVSLADATGNTSYDGDGTSGVYLWGAQLEQRSSVTAYTVTTTQPVTNYIPQLMTAAANVARFDHNPVTGTSLGLLIEEARTNELQYSQEFNNAYWGTSNTTVQPNVIVAPDGTLTGDKLVVNAAFGSSYISKTGLVSGVKTASFYVKAAEYTRIFCFIAGAVDIGASFNLTTQVVTNIGNATGSMQSVGNGWFRCNVYSSTAGTIFYLYPNSSGGFTGDGYSGIYIWGAQLEVGAFATSYIPTAGATATRNADDASMTGTGFTSWYNFAEGTFYYEAAKAQGGNVYNNLLIVRNSNTAINERNPDVAIGTGTGGGAGVFRIEYLTNNVTQASLGDGVSFAANTFYRGATSYIVNNFASAINGGTLNTDTSGQVSNTVNIMQIGSRQSGAQLGGTIKKIAYYPERLTDAQIQSLTSG